MKRAKVNSPYGPTYQAYVREWLEQHGLQGIDSHERRGAIVIVENPEIQAWRSKLSDVEQRRCNHPNSVLSHFRRKSRPVRSGPKTRADRATLHQDVAQHVTDAARQGKPIYWSQACMRRAHQAMLDSRSSDLLTLARVALQAAIRSEADLLALLDDRPKPAFLAKGSKATSTELVHA